jgi:hypothetical protein
MKTALNIIGVILAFVGFVWFLQGINVLPGSFMTGQVKWAVYGAIVLVIGAALLLKMRVRRLMKSHTSMRLGTLSGFQHSQALPWNRAGSR